MRPNENAKKTLLNLPTSIYFDRPETVAALIKNLKRDFFVSITGDSGSGKSTLVKQGLVSKLLEEDIEGRAGTKWRVVTTAPYADPLGNLAVSLCQSDALFKKGTKDADYSPEVETQLRKNSTALTDLYNEAVQENNEAFNLLIIVDQKQELFRYQPFLQNGDREKIFDDVHFINLLLNAHRSASSIYIVLISDSRYFEYFAKFRGLPETMNNYQFQVPDITEAEVRTFLEANLPDRDDPDGAYTIQRDFVEELLTGFRAISGVGADGKDKRQADPFALQKLNLCLSLVLQKWRQTQQANPDAKIDPLVFYKEIGSVKSAITYFITKIVYNDVNYQKEEQKVQLKLLFKALTSKDGNNMNIRRPVGLQELEALIKQAPPNPLAISFLLNPFNRSNERFIRIPEPGKLLPNSIIDIESESLLSNWPELSDWIEEESTHAIVYRNLVRDALDYYAPTKARELIKQKNAEAQKAAKITARERSIGGRLKNLFKDLLSFFFLPSPPDDNDEDYIYKGASLISAMKWLEQCKPTETWALRYLPPKPKLSEFQKNELKTAFPNEVVEELTNLNLAKKFLELSAGRFEKQRQLERGKMAQLQRLLVLALVSTAISIVAFCVAGVFGYKVNNEKTNIELIDFMQVLGYNGVLNIHESEKFYKMNRLIDTIVHTRSIDSRQEVLFELNKRGYLGIDPADKNARLDYDALLNIDDLYDALKNRDIIKEENSRQKILAIYNETERQYKGKSHTQHPFLYYALSAHIYEALKGTTDYGLSTAIDGGALAVDPTHLQNTTYAFGDKNGNIYVIKGKLRDTLLNAGGVIKGVGFSSDGHTLFVGTELGRLYRYDSLHLPMGIHADLQHRLKTDIFTDDRNKSMYFVRPWPSDPGLVLVCNTFQAYFIKQEPGGQKYNHYGPVVPIPLLRVGCREWFPEENLFFTGGRDTTVIYRLSPGSKENTIEQIGLILHPDATILSIAIKSEMVGGKKRLWLALGSETGEVWIAQNLDFSTRRLDVHDRQVFHAFPDYHEASISGLKFNPGKPQLASASIDGMIRFWNLEKLGDKYSDDIVLRNYGQGISAIAYANDRVLVVHQDLYDWMIKTDVEGLKQQLDCIIEQNPDCKNGFNQ